EYGHVLADDPVYAEKAARIASLCRDPSEVLAGLRLQLAPLMEAARGDRGRVAFHSPCSLQHGLGVRGTIEELLVSCGYTLVPVADSHLCCGSAGTYSILQPEISKRLRDNKLNALNTGSPQFIATANIGCLSHLQAGSDLPVRHWVELVDEVLA
ncbi:MAG TPA: heterodisulfide reductase-related iron-sulfur binding cluster, partial [Rhodocyclaceae bacterium]|nr:heterodisulfide reductase-related iron-sulfur binding cluster [Rhodocyclaceae bacterium]